MVARKGGLGKGLDTLIPSQPTRKSEDKLKKEVVVEKVVKKEEAMEALFQ